MTPGRISQLDGLRAIAFLLVFLHHAIKLPLGWIGVDIFFVLSGYLITRNLLSLRETSSRARGFTVFYFRRVLRIFPPYYFALAAMMILFPLSLVSAFWYLGFASNIHDTLSNSMDRVYGPLWSIAVEEQFYLFWPCVVFFFPRRRLSTVFACLIAAAPIIRYCVTPLGFVAVYTLMPCRMDLLAAGAFLALRETTAISLFSRNRRWFFAAAVGSVTIFVAISAIDPAFRTGRGLAFFNVVGFGLVWCFAVAVFGYVRSLEDGPLWRLLMTPAFRYVGTISYTCYLVHMAVLEVVGRTQLSSWRVAVIAFVITLIIASASWYVLERPISALRKHLPVRRPPTSAPGVP